MMFEFIVFLDDEREIVTTEAWTDDVDEYMELLSKKYGDKCLGVKATPMQQ